MNKIISFLLGAGCGSAVTYFLVRKVIEKKADEEIESVVITFKNRMDKIEEILNDEQKEKLGIYSPSKLNKKTEIKDNYQEKVENLGYSVGVDLSEDKSKQVNYTVKHEDIRPAPYVITEEEFGEIGNEEVTLFYYADHIMTDEDENIINDIESLIGDCLTQFGDFDESMYVRNETRETDYVILRSEKNFNDISLNNEVDD